MTRPIPYPPASIAFPPPDRPALADLRRFLTESEKISLDLNFFGTGISRRLDDGTEVHVPFEALRA